MKRLILLPLLALTGCGSPEQPSASASIAEQPAPPALAPEQPSLPTPAFEPVAMLVPPTDAELKTICNEMQNISIGRIIPNMRIEIVEPNMSTLSYTRDDGKRFRYDCRVTGNRIDDRMHDEGGPGTMGNWRQRTWHTWAREGDEIVVTEHTNFD